MDARRLERALSGKAVSVAEDPMMHIEGEQGVTLCGEPVETYPLHWDLATVLGCGLCLIKAGVPLHASEGRNG